MAARYSFDDLLDELFPTKVNGLLEVRAFPSKDRIFVDPANRRAIRHFIEQHPGDGIYFGVATRLKRGDGTLQNCGDLWALFADIDFKGSSEKEARRHLAEFALRPSIIVASGGGLHVYLLLRNPLDIQLHHQRAKDLLRRLAYALGGDLSAAEAARVLRVPDTFNNKYDPPRRATIEVFEPTRVFGLSEVEDVLPKKSEGVADGRRRELLARLPHGERNVRLYEFARSLHGKGFAYPEILAALVTANLERGDPPLPADEVEQVARHAATQPDRSDFRPVAGDRSVEGRGEGGPDGPVLVTLSDVEPESVRWLWPARVAYGKLNLIVGDPDLGKSKVARRRPGGAGSCGDSHRGRRAGRYRSTARGRAWWRCV